MANEGNIRWDLSKPKIDKSLVESNLESLKLEFDSEKLTKELVWQVTYLLIVAANNYELGGHWAVETLDFLKFDESGEVTEDCFGWFIVHPMNPTRKLRKAVRLMASHFIMIEEHARDIQAEAF